MPLINNPNSPQDAGSGLELKIVGRVLNTTGVVFLAIAVALAAAVYENIPAFSRTAIGLVVAALMVVAGEVFSRRMRTSWFPTTMMSSGYALAYFFIYATYYVPGLHVLSEPYACWTLGPALALAGTWHGTQNRSMRWFASAFTLAVTGHALFHSMTSTSVVSMGDMTIKVAAVACFAGMLWCAALSALYKRIELRYKSDSQSQEERLDWLGNRVAHELYFALSAANAMALPLFLSSFSEAPIWWALQAPILLAISWRSGNLIKNLMVAVMWGAAALTMLSSAMVHPIDLPAFFAVCASALAMGSAYRFLKSTLSNNVKIAGYCVYLYSAATVAVIAAYLQFGSANATEFWLIEAVALCALGMALRDRILHAAGCIAAFVGVALFAMHYQTWTWMTVASMVAAAYALSVGYAFIVGKGGWKQAEFLAPFSTSDTVSVLAATRLELFWSFVGFVTLFVAPLQLAQQHQAVNLWAVQSLVLIIVGFALPKLSYRLQGLLALALAACKLVVWDLSSGMAVWPDVSALTLFRSMEFGIVGASALISSFLYFNRERALTRANQSGGTTGGGTTNTGENNPPNDEEGGGH